MHEKGRGKFCKHDMQKIWLEISKEPDEFIMNFATGTVNFEKIDIMDQILMSSFDLRIVQSHQIGKRWLLISTKAHWIEIARLY